MEITLDRILERTATERPGAPFLRFEGTTIRYGRFHYRVRRLASGLGRAGIGPGDAVAVLVGNLPEFIEVT